MHPLMLQVQVTREPMSLVYQTVMNNEGGIVDSIHTIN